MFNFKFIFYTKIYFKWFFNLVQTYRKNKFGLFVLFNSDASQLQTCRKNKYQFLIENVFPREMHLGLITVCCKLLEKKNNKCQKLTF